MKDTLLRFTVLFMLLAMACARPVTPTGGPKDSVPPKVLIEKSTPNLQTNFQKQDIELTFDEWVVLKDVNKQVLISPPLGKYFVKVRDIKLKGKTVTVHFPDEVVLRDSTTYTINFGTAIQDFTEGNAAQDMRFVFSTGPILDSLGFEGQVLDAESDAALEGVTVLLYAAQTPDSVIQKGEPAYYAMTDANGVYKFQNIREGAYRLVAIEEKLADQQWEGPNERIAFSDDLVSLPDSTKKRYGLKLFAEQTELKKTGQNSSLFGTAWIAYNDDPKELLPPLLPFGTDFFTELSGDTVYVRYRNAPDSAWNIVLGKDTLLVRPTNDSLFFLDNALDFDRPTSTDKRTTGRRGAAKAKAAPRSTPTKAIQPLDTMAVLFNRPLESFDTSQIVFEKDTFRMPVPSIFLSENTGRTLFVKHGWEAAATYRLTLLPKAITDWYGNSNRDTLAVRITVLDSSQISNLTLTLDSAQAGMTYWVELSKDGKKIDRTESVKADSNSVLIEFLKLPVSPYTVRIIEDKNANRRWDSGSFLEKRQPERIFTQKIESLKPNWSVETTVILQEGAGKRTVGGLKTKGN